MSTRELPKPLVVEPSGDFDGNDGKWSTFVFRIGQPEQNVKLLIATSGQETWVVAPEGCTQDDPQDCPDTRGLVFNDTESSTWEPNALWSLEDRNGLGYSGNGRYGFDTVALGWQGSGGPNVTHSIVAGIATKDFYLGMFGVSPRPTNFSDFTDPQPSFMSLAKKADLIPSFSYGYTAGAFYRSDGVLGSLTLGGYDLSLFEPNDLTFPLSDVTYRDTVVGVRSITVKSESSSYAYTDAFYPFVDAATPHIWLPLDACQLFEDAFSLEYDADSDLYLVSDGLHEDLLSANASVSFELATRENGPAVTINLPYASFDLQTTGPYMGLENSTRYFPLRHAQNQTQYTLGRTFLQEAYMTVDYERGNFSISQRTFDWNTPSNLVTILPANSSDVSPMGTDPIPSSNSTPRRTFLIVGIVAGIVSLILLILAFVFYRRIRNARRAKNEKKPVKGVDPYIRPIEPELGGHPRFEVEEDRGIHEIPGISMAWELEDKDKRTHEMMGAPMVWELEDTGKTELAVSEHEVKSISTDTRASDTEVESDVEENRTGSTVVSPVSPLSPAWLRAQEDLAAFSTVSPRSPRP
ncbi:acid protease [Patellaria atrata CBS 101060]|uniref:Acid protease n=1 Tax=Patellaria atrata CBS 101060 TaxID=1346257 RepID=A0A9P4VMS6_9PEZI|nr:acid protease [Patellaria atrata CBS 101060]